MNRLLSNFKKASAAKKAFAIVAMLIAISWAVTKMLGFQFGYDSQNSSCLDFTFSIIRQDKDHQFQAGEILAFHPENLLSEQFNGALLGKLVVGIAGDELNASSVGIYINGKKILSDFDLAEPIFIYSGKIPQGSYFAIGTAKGSYDSRYFGFIPQAAIYGVVHPIY
jgi:type IV secretory pathway protease TraF